MKLLTTSNLKTLKGALLGYKTGILHLAPAWLSGYNVCPKASVQCTAACLNTSGMGAFSTVQEARIKKTRMFFEDRDAFLATLVRDIRALVKSAARENMIPCVRLNGTSDIRWENIPVDGAANLMELFPDLMFYDYTKIANRKNIPSNYHLTFSRSESNSADVVTAMRNGFNVAVVFGVKKDAPLPTDYLGREVVNGDDTDLRFLDKRGVVVGLRAKGKARKGNDGFVVTV